MLSDESSSDSDSGIRFKTQSTRKEDGASAALPGRGRFERGPIDNKSFENRRRDWPRNERSFRFRDRRVSPDTRRPRLSPIRRRNSRERSKRSQERSKRSQERSKRSQERSKRSQERSKNSRERSKNSRERSKNSQERNKNSLEKSKNSHDRSRERSSYEKTKDSVRSLRNNSRDRYRSSVNKSNEKSESTKLDFKHVRDLKSLDNDCKKQSEPVQWQHSNSSSDVHQSRVRDFKDEIRRNIISNDIKVPVKKYMKEAQKEFKESHRKRSLSQEQNNSLSQDLSKSKKIEKVVFDKHESNHLSDLDSKKPTEKSSRDSHHHRSSKEKNSSEDAVKAMVSSPPRLEDKNEKSKKKLDKQNSSDLEEQPVSYYNTVIEVSKEVSHEISESEDEEVLRAKLLNLENELKNTKKKKTKKKQKKSKSKHDLDIEQSVTSTTDIKENSSNIAKDNGNKLSSPRSITDASIITSTVSKAKPLTTESNEEGEILSDSDIESNKQVKIDPTDLRHRLSQRSADSSSRKSPDLREKIRSKSGDVMGPELPPNLSKSHQDSENVEGPALPPHLTNKTVGPSISNHLRKTLSEQAEDIHSEEELEQYGPLPTGAEQKWTRAHQNLEERALQMKINSLEGSKSDVTTREEWMLELPDAKAKIIGLGPRSFRAKEGPDMSDRSGWTDTPQRKAARARGDGEGEAPDSRELQREAELQHLNRRDHHLDKAAKKHKKKHKREESLLEIHQKKLKKKKKKEEKESGGVKERRRFDRDVDLQANRFDEAQKKSIIKKAQNLDSRFSRGEAKYL